jgi:ATP adenylyltransferase
MSTPLWAPWRMAYLLASDGEAASECIFCAFPAHGRARHREHLILAAAGSFFVILNRFPYNNGHLMVVPSRHVGDPEGLPADEYQACAQGVRAATRILRETLLPHGFNVGMNLGRAAGAGIDAHCHWHVVPRWNGDTNFMPVLGEVKVMGEHLEASYDRLRPGFAALDAHE